MVKSSGVASSSQKSPSQLKHLAGM